MANTKGICAIIMSLVLGVLGSGWLLVALYYFENKSDDNFITILGLVITGISISAISLVFTISITPPDADVKLDSTHAEWKTQTNDRYQKVVSIIISLSIAALVLPTMFLRNIVAIPENISLISTFETHSSIYYSWILLGGSVFFGIAYYYTSAKWIKDAHQQPIDFFWLFKPKTPTIERLLDLSYFLMIVFFVAGLLTILRFILTYTP